MPVCCLLQLPHIFLHHLLLSRLVLLLQLTVVQLELLHTQLLPLLALHQQSLQSPHLLPQPLVLALQPPGLPPQLMDGLNVLLHSPIQLHQLLTQLLDLVLQSLLVGVCDFPDHCDLLLVEALQVVAFLSLPLGGD